MKDYNEDVAVDDDVWEDNGEDIEDNGEDDGGTGDTKDTEEDTEDDTEDTITEEKDEDTTTDKNLKRYRVDPKTKLIVYNGKLLSKEYTHWIQYIMKHEAHDSAKTHVSQVFPLGSFYFSANIESEFFDEYNKARAANVPVGMAEYPQTNLPVLVDFDFRFDMSSGLGLERQYTKMHIKKTVRAFQSAIKQLFNDVQPKHLLCLVLEKGTEMRVDPTCNKMKDGWHLHFPFCKISAQYQKKELRNRVLQILRKRKVLDDIEKRSEYTLEKMYDSNCISVPWLMYGSTKKEGGLYWKLTKAYDENGKLTNIKNVLGRYKESDLCRLLSIRLPDISVLTLKHKFREEQTFEFIKPKPYLSTREHKEIALQLKQTEKYLKILNQDTWDEYKKWIEIGWAIHNVSQGSEDGLELWKKYSQNSEKYDEKETEKAWRRMRMGSIGLGTICWYARKDNIERYKKVYSKINNITINILLANNTYDKARYIHSVYEGMFVCVDIKKDIWYEFKNHRWQESDSGCQLYIKIPEEITKHIENYLSSLMERKDVTDDVKDAQKEVCRSVIGKLKDVTYRGKIIRELKNMFHDPKFMEKIDTNKKLLCFTNGVYDLDNDYFREGRPTDYITLCTKYAYEPDLSYKDKRVQLVIDFFRKVLVNEHVRKYFIRWCSSCIEGGNKDKLFLLWTGVIGNNGKSTTSELIETTLGEYFIKFPMGTLTGSRAPGGGTTSDLSRMHGRRAGGFQESGNTDVFNIAKLKELTGNESMYTREIFQKARETRPDFKPYLECNRPPKVPVYDKAFYNRLRVILFDSEFTYDAPDNEEEQFAKRKFPMIANFADKLPMLAPAFMWLLIKEYKNYIKEGITPPDEVLSATSDYRRMNDCIFQFISQVIIIDENNDNINDAASLNEIYLIYKEWVRENYPGSKPLDKSELMEDLSIRWGRPEFFAKGYRWRTYMLKAVDVVIDKKDHNKKGSSSGKRNKSPSSTLSERSAKSTRSERSNVSGISSRSSYSFESKHSHKKRK